MTFYKPMLAKIAPKPFSGKNWIFEIKWDGYRAIAYVKDTFNLRNRNGNDLTHKFPELAELKHLAENAVLDGEIVIMKNGRQDFTAMQGRGCLTSAKSIEAERKTSPAMYIVFDILEKDGKSLVKLPLIKRKEILKAAVKEGTHVVVSEFYEENGEGLFRLAVGRDIEGIVAKKKDSCYEQGLRTGSWLKIKNLKSCDCVIFGYMHGGGSRAATFGSLVLGLYDKRGKPNYVGRVRTGFNQQTLNCLRRNLDKITVSNPHFDVEKPEMVTWVKHELVCEIVYMEYSSDKKLRHPGFKRFREDKLPAECTLDQMIK